LNPAALTRISTFPSVWTEACSTFVNDPRSGHVAAYTQRSAAQRLNFVGNQVHEFHAPGAGHDIGTCLGQSARESAADSRTATYHDRHFAVKIQFPISHGCSRTNLSP
jgi:hypothetical protein